MTRWPCDCTPIAATGTFRSGRRYYLLHGVDCDRPTEQRQTVTYVPTGHEAAA